MQTTVVPATGHIVMPHNCSLCMCVCVCVWVLPVRKWLQFCLQNSPIMVYGWIYYTKAYIQWCPAISISATIYPYKFIHQCLYNVRLLLYRQINCTEGLPRPLSTQLTHCCRAVASAYRCQAIVINRHFNRNSE